MTATFVPTPTTVPAAIDQNAADQAPTRSGAKLWRTGAVAGIVASGATAAVAALASAADISLKVSGAAIPVVGFAQLTFVASLIGTIIAIALSHRANQPRRTFVRTTIALTLVSIVPDVLADTHTSTRFTLALTHVVAAALVIPVLASRLHD
jgi:peptidoglycan/LPS O-acetylase OafA/YrhL